ncbi:hypothetical protein FGIG_05467 [Fasciola gigantica]|uniref:Uncharacterized protein n=1 Tax=Fasciola gigantica TaxID=46835 RepID=A0A504YF17_FASGI|nr:hypothetical protein FGIG_05467 [Fasciola gigantica]
MSGDSSGTGKGSSTGPAHRPGPSRHQQIEGCCETTVLLGTFLQTPRYLLQYL